MSYVNQNLMNGESVVYEARVHWFVYAPGAALVLLSFALGDVGPMFFALGLFLLLNALIVRKTTELVITSRRVIAKVGFISRKTIELNHDKVESFGVDQSIFGRIFGFGTVTVNGTGAATVPVRAIDSPMVFRKMAMETVDAARPA